MKFATIVKCVTMFARTLLLLLSQAWQRIPLSLRSHRPMPMTRAVRVMEPFTIAALKWRNGATGIGKLPNPLDMGPAC